MTYDKDSFVFVVTRETFGLTEKKTAFMKTAAAAQITQLTKGGEQTSLVISESFFFVRQQKCTVSFPARSTREKPGGLHEVSSAATDHYLYALNPECDPRLQMKGCFYLRRDIIICWEIQPQSQM